MGYSSYRTMNRLTIVTDAWKPQVNGVVVTLENTIRVLETRGYEVTVIHPYLFRTHFHLPTYPEIELALTTRARMSELLRASRPHFIHIATEGTLGMRARAACIKEGWKFTSAYHTHFPHYVALRIPGMTGITYAILRWFHRASAAVLIPTESIRKDLAAHGFKNLVMWSRGVDTSVFRLTHCTLENAPRPCFVYFGRIAPEKNLEEFLKLDLPGSKLVIGDGPARAGLERKYGKRATFVGYKMGEELVRALACADVAVFPSHTETFGLTIIEALACGIPVAAFDAPGSRDIISSGVDGVIDSDLRRAALLCLSLSKDACRKKAQQYSWDTETENFIRHQKPVHL